MPEPMLLQQLMKSLESDMVDDCAIPLSHKPPSIELPECSREGLTMCAMVK